MQDRPVSATTASQAATSKRVEPVAERASSHSRRDLLSLLIPQDCMREPKSLQASFSRKLTDRVSGGKNARKRSFVAKRNKNGSRVAKYKFYSNFTSKPPFLPLRAILYAGCRKSSLKCRICDTAPVFVSFCVIFVFFCTFLRQNGQN